MRFFYCINSLTLELDEMFALSILLNFIGTPIIICLVGFQTTGTFILLNLFKTYKKRDNFLDGGTYITLFKYMLFLGSSIAQIFLMCFYGNKLIQSVK